MCSLHSPLPWVVDTHVSYYRVKGKHNSKNSCLVNKTRLTWPVLMVRSRMEFKRSPQHFLATRFSFYSAPTMQLGTISFFSALLLPDVDFNARICVSNTTTHTPKKMISMVCPKFPQTNIVTSTDFSLGFVANFTHFGARVFSFWHVIFKADWNLNSLKPYPGLHLTEMLLPGK